MTYAVLGGGISGLSAAYYLTKAGKYGVKLYEAANRVGGWINTVKSRNGTIFELGPRTLRSEGVTSENTLSLIEEVGLMPSVIPVLRTSVAAKKRMLYVNNQLVLLPSGFSSLFRINPPVVKPLIYALWKDLRTPKKPLDDDSVYNFVARRFGEDYAEVICSALVCGVFAGDSKEISIKALLKDAFHHEQEYDGVIRGAMKAAKKKKKYRDETLKWAAWTFQDGLYALPSQLKSFLEEDNRADILLEKRCSKIEFKGGKAILTIDGDEETVNHLYSSLPSRELASILGGQHSFLKTELSSIPFVSVAVVNLEYEGDLIQDKSFGFLVPPNQNLPILGIIFDSCIIPQEGKTTLTVMMGGKWFEQYFGSNPEEKFLLQTAEEHVQKILRIHKDPSDRMVTVLRNCLPQYVVGHSRKVESIREYINEKNLPLTLIGNSFDGVGIHDAIMSAKKNVEKVLARERATLIN